MTDPAPEDRYHYRVIARALALIDAGGPGLSLADLAAGLGMSPAHFQRVFSAWVGVSPKRYQQYLTLDLARRLVADRQPLPAAAEAAGLSGASRLHDLFLRWEAMTPGAYDRRDTSSSQAGHAARFDSFPARKLTLRSRQETDGFLTGIAARRMSA